MKTILVLHGWPQYRLEGYFLSGHLRAKGFRVIYPDLFDQRFEFTLPNLMHKIREMLDGEKPEAIVGISLGGLVAPYIASQFPDAKLIFVASAANMRSKSKVFNMIFSFAQNPIFMSLPKYILNLPNSQFEKIYKLVNPFKGDESGREEYERDTKANVEFIKSISVKKEMEIVNLVKSVDNRLLLKGMKNKTLIFSGEGDLMMPKEKGEELHRLLVNSELIVNKGEHFNVFGPKDLETVESFLEN
jgi:pimeloyl-ACP methyl ester carboxylesterase